MNHIEATTELKDIIRQFKLMLHAMERGQLGGEPTPRTRVAMLNCQRRIKALELAVCVVAEVGYLYSDEPARGERADANVDIPHSPGPARGERSK